MISLIFYLFKYYMEFYLKDKNKCRIALWKIYMVYHVSHHFKLHYITTFHKNIYYKRIVFSLDIIEIFSLNIHHLNISDIHSNLFSILILNYLNIFIEEIQISLQTYIGIYTSIQFQIYYSNNHNLNLWTSANLKSHITCHLICPRNLQNCIPLFQTITT
jgi:hypothetical protein